MALPSNSKRRRCLYDILDVARNADYDTIKQSYKKQARKWHPDKNIDNAEEATIRFKEINEAYEILSDKHERAWYDSHRDAILRGIDKNDLLKNLDENEDYDPDINLMPYFSPFIFNSFDDDDVNSYYNIYNNVFIEIIEIEKLSKKKTPFFGNSKTSYHKMKQFYDFWEQFISKRSFQWTTKYNLNDAQNRKIRKLMHKENRKLIDSKRKKWEDTIIRLVLFIKKRDPRFRAYLIDFEKQKFEEQQRMRQYQKEIDEIMKEEYKKQREIEIEQQKKLLQERADAYDDDIDDIAANENEEIYECVVCNKSFKSENAFKTHESSKKHLKQLQDLQFQLKMENEILFNDDNENENEKDEKINEQTKLDELLAQQLAQKEDVQNDQNKKEDKIDLDYLVALTMEQEEIMDVAGVFDDDDVDDIEKNRNGLITDSEILALLDSGIDIDSLINTYSSLTKEYILNLKNKNKQKKSPKKNHHKKKRKKYENEANNDNNENDEEEELDEFMKNLTTFGKHKKNKKNNQYFNKHKNENNDNMNDNVLPQKTKKKRRRRKNKESKNQTNLRSPTQQSHQSNIPKKSTCNACKEMFASRGKLYNHLKQFPMHALKSQHI